MAFRIFSSRNAIQLLEHNFIKDSNITHDDYFRVVESLAENTTFQQLNLTKCSMENELDQVFFIFLNP